MKLHNKMGKFKLAEPLFEAVRVVYVVEIGSHFGAEPILGYGMTFSSMEAKRTAILNFGDNSARVRAIMWACANNSFDCHSLILSFMANVHGDIRTLLRTWKGMLVNDRLLRRQVHKVICRQRL